MEISIRLTRPPQENLEKTDKPQTFRLLFHLQLGSSWIEPVIYPRKPQPAPIHRIDTDIAKFDSVARCEYHGPGCFPVMPSFAAVVVSG